MHILVGKLLHVKTNKKHDVFSNYTIIYYLDARVMMLKHQIYQECALNNVRVNQSKNSYNQRRPTR